MGPKPPTLVGASVNDATILLQIPGVTPYVPSALIGHQQEFDLTGFSGYGLSAAGATPIIVLSRPSNADSAGFLQAVVDQHPLSTSSQVVITTLTPTGTAVVQKLLLTGVTVDAVAAGWATDVVVLKYATLTEQYPDNSTTQTITPNLNDSVAPDFGPASSNECGSCTGVFHGDLDGQSNITNFTLWNEANQWVFYVTHTPSGTSIRAQTSLLQNATTNTVVKAMAAQTAQTRFEARLIRTGAQSQQLTPVAFACTSASFIDARRAPDNTMQFSATVSGCTGGWQRYTAQGTPTGAPVTFTSP